MATVVPIVFTSLAESVEKTAKVCTDATVKGDPKFIEKMFSWGHLTPFEHNGMILSRRATRLEEDLKNYMEYCKEEGHYQPAFRINADGCVVGSFRSWLNLKATPDTFNDLIVHLELDYWKTRRTFLVETNIGIAREILRHRCLSFTERSTRYVKQFEFLPTVDNTAMTSAFNENLHILNDLKNHKIKRDQYREILPLGTKTAFYMTGFEDQLQSMIDLRDTTHAHAGARSVAEGVKQWL